MRCRLLTGSCGTSTPACEERLEAGPITTTTSRRARARVSIYALEDYTEFKHVMVSLS
jgi:hypothetical protein